VYPQDLPVPRDCLHVATVRADVACGTLTRIDARGALTYPGVRRVLTAADVRGTNRFGLIHADQPVLVESRICGASDVVALVVADTERAAREGARRVRLSISPVVGLFDPSMALHVDAPVVHADHRAHLRHPNLVAERAIRRGLVARAFARAALVIAGDYHTGFVEHAFLAPEAGVAYPDADGRLTIHVATQWPEADLRQAAAALGEPRDRLRLVQETIGGAFGGREDVSLQILLLLAAREMARPVRMVWDRAESTRGHGKRHPFRIHHELAADRTGRLLAARVDLLIDAGCYASTSAQLLDNALVHACGPYDISAVELSGRAVYTNNPYTCAFRGFGANQVAFAMEQQMSKLAHALTLDPGDVRRRNYVRAPGTFAAGSTVTAGGGLSKTLTLARQRARTLKLPSATDTVKFGRGLASATKNIGFGFGFDDHATAVVHVMRDRATVRIGAAEVGQGVATVLAQIAGATLGLPVDRIQVEWRDTDVAPDAGSSSASRQTIASGNAVLRACERARRSMSAQGGLDALSRAGVTARATFRFPKTRALGVGRARHVAMFGWSTCCVDVAVDIDTGQVSVLRVVNAVDAGRVINPVQFEGQVEGGVVMGQGYALQERCRMERGLPVATGFEGCGVPTSVDAVPVIEIIAVEDRELSGPFGARGIGEITMIPIVPAITAAIHDACGVWIDELPASPERIREALAAQRARVPRS
jgi:CO/xanthine dehydrogenase Mo-binding subunit